MHRRIILASLVSLLLPVISAAEVLLRRDPVIAAALDQPFRLDVPATQGARCSPL